MRTISITVDEDLLQGVDRAARASNRTRSELFRIVLREWLAARRQRKLAAEDRAAYGAHPAQGDEFAGLIAAQPLDDQDRS